MMQLSFKMRFYLLLGPKVERAVFLPDDQGMCSQG